MTDSLLSRLQSLPKPGREIDAEIALANGWRKYETDEDYHIWCPPGAGVGTWQTEPPRYTESLDAALTLLPERARWRVGNWFNAYADITLPNGVKLRADAATPAIALLIAIMKAKEESKP